MFDSFPASALLLPFITLYEVVVVFYLVEHIVTLDVGIRVSLADELVNLLPCAIVLASFHLKPVVATFVELLFDACVSSIFAPRWLYHQILLAFMFFS